MGQIGRVFKKFPQTFWVANTMELFERWAWYGMYMVFALYLTGSKDTGALGFSQDQKALLISTGTALLYFLPLLTGAIADKLGYRKVLLISYGIYASGFLMIGYMSSFLSVFIVFLYLAIGGSLFKPVISATIARTTDEETSSIGFGIFYMMVNIGSFIAPFFSSYLRELEWVYVFWLSAGIIGLNTVLVLTLYKEPIVKTNKQSLGKSFKQAFQNIAMTMSDVRLVLFLVIIAAFWGMYYQLFYTLPVFIEQWVDTSILYDAIANTSGWLAENVGTKDKTINPELIVNIDSLYIILFQVLISALVMKFKPLNAMISGIFIAGIGMGLMFMTNNPFFLIPSILVFAVGEMSSSPKITEYLGRIAPKDKVALYIGASYVPVFLGSLIAGVLSGPVYTNISDKRTMTERLVADKGFNLPEISGDFTFNQFFAQTAELMGMNNNELTTYLWNANNPQNIWMVYTAVGVGAALLLLLYDRFVLKSVKE